MTDHQACDIKVSIILPVLNEAANLVSYLKPLCDSVSSSVEIIVVDGRSEDNTQALLTDLASHYPNLYFEITKAGRASQMNAGAALAKGGILLFLHADTLLPDQFERELLTFNQSNHQWGRFDVLLSDKSFAFKVIAWFMNKRSRLTSIATGDQAIFTKRQSFEALDGFPNQLLMEDVEFCKRAKKLSAPFCSRLKVTTDARRWKKHGVAKTVLLMWSFRLRYFLGADPALLYKKYYSL